VRTRGPRESAPRGRRLLFHGSTDPRDVCHLQPDARFSERLGICASWIAPTHLACIAVERHQTEEGLRESERRFSLVFYANALAMSITRFADSRFLYVNDKFVTMYGYSRANSSDIRL